MALGQGVKPPFPRTKTGCLTCRGRKVKCDEAKPNCRTCQRLKLDCRWQTDKNKNGGKSTSTTWTSDLVTATTRKPVTQKTRIPGETFVFEFPNVDRAAMQYIHHYISFCSRFLVYVADGDGNPFQRELVPFVTTSPALLHSMVALAAGHMARSDRQHKLKATVHYTHALRELKTALTDPVAVRTNATLGACLLLCVYEIAHSEKPSWVQHLQGARDLISYRGGPKKMDFLLRFFSLLDVSGSLFAGRPTLFEGPYWIVKQQGPEEPSSSTSDGSAPAQNWPYYDHEDRMTREFHSLMVFMAQLSELSSEALSPDSKRDAESIRAEAERIYAALMEWWSHCPKEMREQPTNWRRLPRPRKLTVVETLEGEAFSSTRACMHGCVLLLNHICDPYGKEPRKPEVVTAVQEVLEIAQETPEGCGLEMGLYWGLFQLGATLYNEDEAEEIVRKRLQADTRVSLYHADRALELLQTLWHRQHMFNTKYDWRRIQKEMGVPVFLLT